MKGIFKKIIILFLIVVFPCMISAEEDNRVKVYIFEAGGCPYCEAEVEYLQGLDSYNKLFVIERKELYVDHVEWKQGKDYELGKKVAELFLEAGFKNASYQGTPFVVISDLYAAATYSTSLESVIKDAYNSGDKDIVKCVSEGKECSISSDITPENKTEEKTNNIVLIVMLITLVVLFVSLLIIIPLKNKNNR